MGGGIGGSAMPGLGSFLSGGYELGTGTLGNLWSNFNGFESLDHSSYLDVADFIDPLANGGIMTEFGPTPLRKYANGGIANDPQLTIR